MGHQVKGFSIWELLNKKTVQDTETIGEKCKS